MNKRRRKKAFDKVLDRWAEMGLCLSRKEMRRWPKGSFKVYDDPADVARAFGRQAETTTALQSIIAEGLLGVQLPAKEEIESEKKKLYKQLAAAIQIPEHMLKPPKAHEDPNCS